MSRDLHHGRPGSKIIPTDWAAQHRPTAEQTMGTALCEIRKPSTLGSLNTTTGQHAVTPGVLVYSGKCRVVRLAQADRQERVAEQLSSLADYMVTLPTIAIGIRPGHKVTFTAGDDADLLDLTMTVVATVTGSHIWERDVFCVADISPPAT